MTVNELIKSLQVLEGQGCGDDVVKIWNGDYEAMSPVTGNISGGGDGIVELFSDVD